MVSMIPHRRSQGSPPRVRGKARGAWDAKARKGITPAYAGKRTIPQRPTPTWRDHPRVCGEKFLKQVESLSYLGSPPRMRGKVHLTAYFFIIWGITPACAGKSCRRCPQRSRSRDHPRVCGEKADNDYDEKPIEGSPPRMRGKDSDGGQRASASRITPAYAGKSSSSRLKAFPIWDHPRVCGEKGKQDVK